MSAIIDEVAISGVRFGVMPDGQRVAKASVTFFSPSTKGRMNGNAVDVAVYVDFDGGEAVDALLARFIDEARNHLTSVAAVSQDDVSKAHEQWKAKSIAIQPEIPEWLTPSSDASST